ncbi:hypothetical protein KFE94_06015 [bacterium SCSIO 12643]|nr:hypothetical protein KFE94_06015 [bacterium SCSIO 12643]
MESLRKGRLGLLEKTLLEFKEKGYTSLEEIREYLSTKYKLTVSNTVLRRRMESLSF